MVDHLKAIWHKDGGFDVAGYFEPIIVDKMIVSYNQYDPDHTFIRHVEFATPQRSDVWVNSKKVRECAKLLMEKDEEITAVFLSYDGSITRVVWMVKVSNSKNSRYICVDGGRAYVQPERAESTG
jgi:hypothetical protein